MSLDLAKFREVNERRRAEWANRDGSSPWCGADFSNEMGGECGEAQNIVKKLRRIETGYKGPSKTEAELLSDLAEELADVIITADLVAMYYGIDLDAAVPLKFNKTSVKQNLNTRFPDAGVANHWTFGTVPNGWIVPGSGTIIAKSPHVGGYHITFHRLEPFNEVWTSFRLIDDKVPTDLTPTGLVYW